MSKFMFLWGQEVLIMKLALKVLLGACLFVGLLITFSSCLCSHEYLEATCISGKVCKICGRIDEALKGDEWYNTEYKFFGSYRMRKDSLSQSALKLPKWYTHDYFDKFAHRGE